MGLYRRMAPTEPTTGRYEPSICPVAQRAKMVGLGDERYLYDAADLLKSKFNWLRASLSVTIDSATQTW